MFIPLSMRSTRWACFACASSSFRSRTELVPPRAAQRPIWPLGGFGRAAQPSAPAQLGASSALFLDRRSQVRLMPCTPAESARQPRCYGVTLRMPCLLSFVARIVVFPGFFAVIKPFRAWATDLGVTCHVASFAGPWRRGTAMMIQDARVIVARVRDGAPDLEVRLSNGLVLEVLTLSAGYECWQTCDPSGRCVVSGGRDASTWLEHPPK